MSSTADILVNAVVIAILIFVIYLMYIVLGAKKNNSTKLLAGKWMKREGFKPDQSHFYRGTGIAIKSGENRLLLVINDKPDFFRKEDIASLRTYDTTVTSGRPLGLAPGVVGQINITNYNIDISLKNGEPSVCMVSFEKNDLMKAWEKRIQEIIDGKT
jgi:hypothetical protein